MGIQIQGAQNNLTKSSVPHQKHDNKAAKIQRESLEIFKRKVTHYVQKSSHIQQIG